MASLAAIRRHPIKGIGHEALDRADLSPDGAVHGDRAWALLTEAAQDTDAWQPRRNFLVVASGPGLAPVGAHVLSDGRIRLTHPQRDALTFDPAAQAEELRAWIGDLWPAERPGPARLVRAQGHGMTDIEEPVVSIGSMTSLRALSDLAGSDVDHRRFRINLWVDGWAPWEEASMVGQTITIGSVRMNVVEPIERCRAPDANPETGNRDIGMLALLQRERDTRDFGLYARVLNPGSVSVGDEVTP